MTGDAEDSVTSAEPPDRGLQNERTALAWQRTLLSGLACALVSARLLALVSLPAALLTCVAVLGCTGALAVTARRRFRRNATAVVDHVPLADARAPLVVTLLVLLTGLAVGGFVLAGAAQS